MTKPSAGKMATTQNPSQSTSGPTSDILNRIECALEAARGVVSQFVSGRVKAERKTSDRTLVTEADRAVNRTLREALLRDHEGWLSEEDVDNPQRLKAHRVWIVDPLDGTKEFVAKVLRLRH
jgi:myo-inositol-1(or 4)-monophosphatase